MKLMQLVSVTETMLESRIEPIKMLLESKVNTILPMIFNLFEVSVNEHFNNRGNYALITRVTIEHSGNLSNEELDKYCKELLDTIDLVVKSLLESKNTLFNHRSSTIKLL